MIETAATAKADEFIKLLLENQEDPLGKYPLMSDKEATRAAQTLAVFRQQLIAQLMQQS